LTLKEQSGQDITDGNNEEEEEAVDAEDIYE
jgi:hypothetical protein